MSTEPNMTVKPPDLFHPMRSKLFVPGTRPELFVKAMASAADVVSFDLEDSVVPARKVEAREAVVAFIHTCPIERRSRFVVRVNPVGSSLFQDDVVAITDAGISLINIPMLESAGEVRAAADLLKRMPAGNQIGILANIETPRGLRLAAEIACADPIVIGLQIGYADLFEPYGVARNDLAAIDHVRMSVRLAAAEAGIAAYDGAFADIRESSRYREECERSAKLGFAGKSCIHPSQIAIANASFMPNAAEVEKARRIVTASCAAAAKGVGAFTVDGQMVDAPFLRRAEIILAWADKLASADGPTETHDAI